MFTAENQPSSRRPSITLVQAREIRRTRYRALLEAERRTGYTVSELLAMHPRSRSNLMKSEGLPRQCDLARDAGVSPRLMSLLLRGLAYTDPGGSGQN